MDPEKVVERMKSRARNAPLEVKQRVFSSYENAVAALVDYARELYVNMGAREEGVYPGEECFVIAAEAAIVAFEMLLSRAVHARLQGGGEREQLEALAEGVVEMGVGEQVVNRLTTRLPHYLLRSGAKGA